MLKYVPFGQIEQPGLSESIVAHQQVLLNLQPKFGMVGTLRFAHPHRAGGYQSRKTRPRIFSRLAREKIVRPTHPTDISSGGATLAGSGLT